MSRRGWRFPNTATAEESRMPDEPVWKILIADDNPQNVELVEAFLSGFSCTTEIAVDGEDTLRKTAELQPDLILLDIMMPKVSGFEVCKRLKSDPKFADTPILMVTSLHEAADIDRGVEAGADDFLSKPIHRQVLLHRVKKLLEVRHIKNERDRLLAYIREVESSAKDGGSRH
jgi:two-component system, OmpR family, alkaline phosphatase synthesis response regulator PhoP